MPLYPNGRNALIARARSSVLAMSFFQNCQGRL